MDNIENEYINNAYEMDKICGLFCKERNFYRNN